MNLRLLILPLVLAACSPTPQPEPAPATPGQQAAPAPMAVVSADATPEATLLGQYHWQLHEAVDGDGKPITALLVKPDKPLQLDFSDDRVAVGNSCNRMSGNVKLERGALHIGSLMQTKMACDDAELMQLDSTVGERLPGDSSIKLNTDANPPRLILTYASGEVLTFTGTPTAQTRYGSAGETVFLEVAAQTAPCDESASTGEQCPKVRERHYGENGVVVDNDADWHVLRAPIEGYQHESGVNNVLRVTRYTLKQPAANGERYAWVLDMVIESERAPR